MKWLDMSTEELFELADQICEFGAAIRKLAENSAAANKLETLLRERGILPEKGEVQNEHT